MPEASWLEVSLTVDGELAEAVAEVLARFAPNGVVIETTAVSANPDDSEGHAVGPLRVSAYLPMDEQVEETRRRLEEALWYLGSIRPLPPAQFKPIQETNWAESWKQHYQPIAIGKRLMIVPAWLDPPLKGRTAIRIDPGMAFGTGTHPTTQLCLEIMDGWMTVRQYEDGEGLEEREILRSAQNDNQKARNDNQKAWNDNQKARNDNQEDQNDNQEAQNDNKEARNDNNISVIDVGCGSGILAIAALKLGAKQALGVDIDPEAMRAAQENAALNGVTGQLELGLGSLSDIQKGAFSLRKAPLVLANILAPVLVRLLDEGLGSLIMAEGLLVLSGVLEEQASEVEVAALKNGLVRVDRRQIGDWVALAFSPVEPE
jgi:ribosomal protein L11 methylase PrmA